MTAKYGEGEPSREPNNTPVSRPRSTPAFARRDLLGELFAPASERRADSMTDICERYNLPSQLRPFLESGLLEVLSEDEARKTIEFHLPRLRRTDNQGRITTFSLTWINPDFNAQYCHYYAETPGDSPNFYVTEDTTDVGDEQLDIDSVEELVEWLEQHAVTA